MKYTRNQFEEITELCRHILRTAEVVAQKCGNRDRAFMRAYWDLDKVQDTCLILRYYEGCKVVLHYKEAAWSQASIVR